MKWRTVIISLIVAAALAAGGSAALAQSKNNASPESDVHQQENLVQSDTGYDSSSGTLETPFTVNPGRVFPYKQNKFRVKWDGKYIPGITTVSGLERTTEVLTYREGGEPSIVHKSPGLTEYEPIVLERGRTHDTAFEEWANKVWNFGAGLGSEVSLADFQKNIIVELYNEAGQLVMRWLVYQCWPSEYSAVAGFNATKSSVAIESITLQNEGWERDYEVTEPAQPSFSEP